MGKHKKHFSFTSVDFIVYVWTKRKLLITITIIAAIVSAIVSFTITPKFKSSVVLFPASSGSISKTLISQAGNPKDDILKFGSEEEAEQLLQVLNSEEIRSKIIKKYDLAKHYKIDTASRFWRTKLFNEYKSNIKFKLTEYMSVVVEVLDKHPDTAAFIANEISDQIDTVMSRIQNDRAKKALALVEKEYNEMVNQMNQMSDSLRKIRELGVINYKAQSKALNDAYAKALVQGNAHGIKEIEAKLKILAKYGGKYNQLSDLLLDETLRLSDLRGKFMEAKVDAEQTIPHKFVVDKAYTSEKKAYPIRSLIVLVSALSAFFIALLLVIIRDSISNRKKN
jgi:uncharacterized protein involved in exopolysaccharide biosynthesis